MRGLTVKIRAFSICMAIQYIGVMKSGVKLVQQSWNNQKPKKLVI
jgi:hypothetical protein